MPLCMMMTAAGPRAAALVGGRLDGEGGAGGGQPGLQPLALPQLPLPHLLDVLLDVRQLADLRLCNQ